MPYEFNPSGSAMNELLFLSAKKNSVFCGLHVHRHIELVLVFRGRLDMEICRRRFSLRENDMLFVNPYEPHSYFSTVPNDSAIIEITPSLYPPLWSQLLVHRADTRITHIPTEVTAFIRRLLPDNTETSEFSQIPNTHSLAIVAPLCHTLITENHWEDAPAPKPEQDLFLHALSLIDENYNKPITREWIASNLGIRPETVSRLFIRRCGMTFVKYLQHIRLYDAMASMQNGVPITVAALTAGFGSISGFNRVFRELINCTPSEYLEQCITHS